MSKSITYLQRLAHLLNGNGPQNKIQRQQSVDGQVYDIQDDSLKESTIMQSYDRPKSFWGSHKNNKRRPKRTQTEKNILHAVHETNDSEMSQISSQECLKFLTKLTSIQTKQTNCQKKKKKIW